MESIDLVLLCCILKHAFSVHARTTAGVKTVTASNCTANAVGLSPCLNVEIEGVSVTELVDTGSKCTIISHSVLRAKKSRYLRLSDPVPPFMVKEDSQTIKSC